MFVVTILNLEHGAVSEVIAPFNSLAGAIARMNQEIEDYLNDQSYEIERNDEDSLVLLTHQSGEDVTGFVFQAQEATDPVKPDLETSVIDVN